MSGSPAGVRSEGGQNSADSEVRSRSRPPPKGRPSCEAPLLPYGRAFVAGRPAPTAPMHSFRYTARRSGIWRRSPSADEYCSTERRPACFCHAWPRGRATYIRHRRMRRPGVGRAGELAGQSSSPAEQAGRGRRRIRQRRAAKIRNARSRTRLCPPGTGGYGGQATTSDNACLGRQDEDDAEASHRRGPKIGSRTTTTTTTSVPCKGTDFQRVQFPSGKCRSSR